MKKITLGPDAGFDLETIHEGGDPVKRLYIDAGDKPAVQIDMSPEQLEALRNVLSGMLPYLP